MDPTISLVTDFCPPYNTGLFERFADRFDTQILFCNSRDAWRAYGDFDFVELSGPSLRDRYKVTPTLFAHLAARRPDVIVGNPVEGFGGQASYCYASLTRTPFVLWTGEWHLPLTTLRTVTFPLIRRIYRGADAIAVYGPHIADYLADLGIAREKMFVAWNTVDLSKFSDPGPERRRAVRDSLDLPAESPIVLFVGRHVHEKGIEYLIDGFAMADDAVDATPSLVVAGDGPVREELETRAADLPLAVFPGYVDNDDLPGYYAAADVLVLPSIQTNIFREPWGLVINEAMSCGTPVIATGQVGAAAAGVVRDGETGFVVPERNAHVIADRLVRLFEDPNLASTMGDRAAQEIADYDYNRTIDGFEAAIDEALSRY